MRSHIPLENERDLIREELRALLKALLISELDDIHFQPGAEITKAENIADLIILKVDSILEKKREEIESMKKEQDDISTYPPNILTGEDYQNTGYNQALSDIQDIMKL